LFLDANGDDFHLKDNSPCISAGTDTVMIGSTWYHQPLNDFEGNSRPNPVGTMPDIGAFENDNGQSITGIKENVDLPLIKCQLYQNYPNPCSSTTTIEYSTPIHQMVTLKVYDIQGREVAVLINEMKKPGKYSVTFNTEKLMNGVYFYQLIAGGSIQTHKCLILR
jgi:hypothetical protein